MSGFIDASDKFAAFAVEGDVLYDNAQMNQPLATFTCNKLAAQQLL